MLIIGGNGKSIDASGDLERFERDEPIGEPPVRKARAGGLFCESPVRKALAGESFNEQPVRKARADGLFGEPPVREARDGALIGSTFWMVDGGRLAFTPKAPANIDARSDFEGNFGATFVSGGDDGDSSV